MAFALAINHLIDAMEKPGCPICRLFREASERAVESFLWENVNDPQVRQGIIASYGFCGPHTRLMVARELFTSSVPVGANIIYEHLGRLVAGELSGLRPSSRQGGSSISGLGARLRAWLKKAGLGKFNAARLQPRGECPVCEAGNTAALNSLFVLCEEVRKQGDVHSVYQAADGLCLGHLRTALDLHSERFPDALRFLMDNTIARLTQQSAHMNEFIRKNNWSYRDEKPSEAEDTALRKTLTFFTGYPSSAFTHKTDEF
jgi:hypothetical protein